MLTEEEVKHVAKLARLKLSDEEVKTFSSQMNDILKYAEVLKKVDTENVEETSQVTGLENVKEEDEIKRKCEGRELLKSSPLPIERNQIRVKPVISN